MWTFTKWLMSFLKPYVIFYNTVHIYFLSQTLRTFYKSSLSKWKFSDLPLLTFKFTKCLMSFLEPRVSFSSNFASLFSVIETNSSVLFVNLYILWTKGSNQSTNFQAFDCLHENWPNSLSFFRPQISFPLNFASAFSVMIHNSSEIF